MRPVLAIKAACSAAGLGLAAFVRVGFGRASGSAGLADRADCPGRDRSAGSWLGLLRSEMLQDLSYACTAWLQSAVGMG